MRSWHGCPTGCAEGSFTLLPSQPGRMLGFTMPTCKKIWRVTKANAREVTPDIVWCRVNLGILSRGVHTLNTFLLPFLCSFVYQYNLCSMFMFSKLQWE
jgi:hypothetical protein